MIESGVAALGAALVAVIAGGTAAYAVGGPLDGTVTVTETADRVVRAVGDLAVVFDIGSVDPFVVEASGAAAERAGGVAAPSRSGSLGMWRLTRAGTTVHAPPAGYLIPMVFVSLPRAAVGRVMGADVAQALAASSIVMNELTAGLMGAEVGDVIEIRGLDGSTVALEVGGIRPYAQIGSAELVFTTEVAERLGVTSDTRVVIWGFDDRDALDEALADVGLIGRRDTKVVRSWDPPDPDDTLSTARTKALLGEPWYRIAADGSISMHPTWLAENLMPAREVLNETIRIRARCHLLVVDDLRAALAEVAAAGLASAIDVANANTYGGCYSSARYSRISTFLSRHSYGMALDTNTATNCQGCTPTMNCEVVRIFRRHGFAWGGNFRRPDGMHFEWVGEPRDQISFASRYCPNVANPAVESAPTAAALTPTELLAGGEQPYGEHIDAP